MYPGEPLKQAAVVIGSIGPDIALVPLFVLDKVRGQQPLADQDRHTMLFKEVSHSLPIAFVGFFLSIVCDLPDLLVGFFAGAMVHIIIDTMTHCGPQFATTDQSCIWPLGRYVPKLGSVMGMWEYRYDHGILRPKPVETFFCVTMIMTWLGCLIWQ